MPATLVDRAPLYIVNRGGFDAFGVTLETGEVVDCSEWRNVQPLVNVRQISPVLDPEAVTNFVTTSDNRVFRDQKWADFHEAKLARIEEEAKAERERVAETRAAAKRKLKELADS